MSEHSPTESELFKAYKEVKELRKGRDTLFRKWEEAIKQRDNAEKLCREQANKINQQRMEIQALQAELNSLGASNYQRR